MLIREALSPPPRLKGSKPTSPGRDPSRSLGRGRKGRALDISFSALRAVVVVDVEVWAGAKAAAEPASAEIRVSFMFVVVYCCVK